MSTCFGSRVYIIWSVRAVSNQPFPYSCASPTPIYPQASARPFIIPVASIMCTMPPTALCITQPPTPLGRPQQQGADHTPATDMRPQLRSLSTFQYIDLWPVTPPRPMRSGYQKKSDRVCACAQLQQIVARQLVHMKKTERPRRRRVGTKPATRARPR